MTFSNLDLVLIASSIFCLIFNTHALERESILVGETPAPGEYAYHVSVNLTHVNVCGGALISNLFVLTAAHCVTREYNQFVDYPVLIQAGSNSLSETKAVRLVNKMYVPEEYHHGDYYADIAVLRVLRPFRLDLISTKISYVRLPYGLRNHHNQTGVFTGFGYDSVTPDFYSYLYDDYYAAHTQSGLLKYSKVDVVESKECQPHYAFGFPYFPLQMHTFTVDKRFVCARALLGLGTQHVGPCHGDSGGPLVIDNEIIIGVLVTSHRNCDEGIKPSAYTRVYHYLDFIENAQHHYIHHMRYIDVDLKKYQKDPKYFHLDDLFK